MRIKGWYEEQNEGEGLAFFGQKCEGKVWKSLVFYALMTLVSHLMLIGGFVCWVNFGLASESNG